MSIFSDMFKGSTQPTTPAAASPTQQAQDRGLSSPNPATDQSGQIPGSSQTPVNPLDAYSKMFDDAAKNSDIQAPSFKLDSKVVQEVAGKMTFTEGIDPALAAKATSGDTQALMQLLNTVGQKAYSASLEHAATLTDKHLSIRSDYEGKRVAQDVRSQLTHSELSSMPSFDHPVVRAEMTRVADTFMRANPDATPQQAAQAAKDYVASLYQALNPAQTGAQSSSGKDVNWDEYFRK